MNDTRRRPPGLRPPQRPFCPPSLYGDACPLASRESRRQTTLLRRYIIVMLGLLILAHLALLFNLPALLKQVL